MSHPVFTPEALAKAFAVHNVRMARARQLVDDEQQLRSLGLGPIDTELVRIALSSYLREMAESEDGDA